MTTDQLIHDHSRITALVSSGHRVLTDCDADGLGYSPPFRRRRRMIPRVRLDNGNVR